MKTRFILAGLLTMTSAALASASPIPIPSGLTPGDTYFLAFVTAGTVDATSSNIADYDAFVTAQANMDPLLAALGTTWLAIGSTPTIDAVTHIGANLPPFTGPVYNLSGQQVATGSYDLFDGSLFAPILYNQFGAANPTEVWTGTYIGGLIDIPLGFYNPDYGYSAAIDFGWLTLAYGGPDSSLNRAIYGISGPLVVPSAPGPEPSPVPEPGTVSLTLGPLLVLVRGAHRRWRCRRATPATQFDAAFH